MARCVAGGIDQAADLAVISGVAGETSGISGIQSRPEKEYKCGYIKERSGSSLQSSHDLFLESMVEKSAESIEIDELKKDCKGNPYTVPERIVFPWPVPARSELINN